MTRTGSRGTVSSSPQTIGDQTPVGLLNRAPQNLAVVGVLPSKSKNSPRLYTESLRSMNSYTEFLESALAREERAQRFHMAFAGSTVLAGIALVAFVQFAPGEFSSGVSKQLLTLGGTFLSSLASLPLKEFFRRGDRLAALSFLLQGFRELAQGPGDPSPEREAALVSRFWKLVDAGLEA